MKNNIVAIDFSIENIENIFQEIKKGYNYVLNETNCDPMEIYYLAPEWFINVLKKYIQEYSFIVPSLSYIINIQKHYKNEFVVFNKNYVFHQKCSSYIIELNIN